MNRAVSVKFGHGTIFFKRTVTPVPGSSRTEGDASDDDEDRPGLPDHYEVMFAIDAEEVIQGVRNHNSFCWNEIVFHPGASALVHDIEARAARNIAPMLRLIADRIETLVADFDSGLVPNEGS